MDCSTPGFLVPHLLPEFAQVHVHCISDAIQPPQPLSPLLLLPSIFSASKTFPMSRLFTSDDQNTGVSVSASVPPVNIQDWFPIRLTGLILLSKGLSGVSSSTTVQRYQFSGVLPSLWSTSHNHGEHWVTIALTIRILVGRVMSLLFNTLFRFVITFLLRSNHLLISWLLVTVHSDSRAQEEEICHYFHFSPFYFQYIPTSYIFLSLLQSSFLLKSPLSWILYLSFLLKIVFVYSYRPEQCKQYVVQYCLFWVL